MHSYLHTCIHAYLHTCILEYLHTCILAYMHNCIHAYLHTCILAYLHTCILVYSHTCMLAYLHACILENKDPIGFKLFCGRLFCGTILKLFVHGRLFCGTSGGYSVATRGIYRGAFAPKNRDYLYNWPRYSNFP